MRSHWSDLTVFRGYSVKSGVCGIVGGREKGRSIPISKALSLDPKLNSVLQFDPIFNDQNVS